METIYEVVRIKQVLQEVQEELLKEGINCPSKAVEIARYFIADEDREVFLVMCLNTKNHVIAVHRCHIGSLNASIASPQSIFKSAILNNACSIIVAHNHPSTVVSPSSEDRLFTQRLRQAGDILNIPVLDSLIVAQNGDYYSFKEHGYI